MRRIAAVSVALLGGAGCTILSGLSDLEAAKDGTDIRDGGVSADGTVAVVPGTDATTQDETSTTPPNDSSVDGTFTNFCDTVPPAVEVCLDYDSKSVGATEQVHEHSTLTVDAPGHNSLNALHCTGVDELSPQCFHIVQLPPNPTKVHLTFDLQILEIGHAIEVNEVEFGYETGKCAIQPTIDGTGVYINEFCPDQGTPDQVNHQIGTLTALASKEWLAFDVTLDLTARTISGSFDQASGRTSFQTITLDARFVTSESVQLHAGMSFGVKNTPASQVRTDNLTVDTQ